MASGKNKEERREELRTEAIMFADDIVCAAGTDFMTAVAEAENKFIFQLLRMMENSESEQKPRGHWISLTDCANAGVYCSECGKKVWKEDCAWCNRKNKIRSKYCPNCGARMTNANT